VANPNACGMGFGPPPGGFPRGLVSEDRCRRDFLRAFPLDFQVVSRAGSLLVGLGV
jgi:hypothetical protein